MNTNKNYFYVDGETYIAPDRLTAYRYYEATNGEAPDEVHELYPVRDIHADTIIDVEVPADFEPERRFAPEEMAHAIQAIGYFRRNTDSRECYVRQLYTFEDTDLLAYLDYVDAWDAYMVDEIFEYLCDEYDVDTSEAEGGDEMFDLLEAAMSAINA